MTCQKCNFLNEETAKFCRNCGIGLQHQQPQPNMFYTCPKCNLEIETDDAFKFCYRCGAEMELSNEKTRKNKKKLTVSEVLQFLFILVALFYFIFIFPVTVNNSDTSKIRIFVPEQCEHENIGLTPHPSVPSTDICVISDVAEIHKKPRQFTKKYGYVVQYDKLRATSKYKNGYLRVRVGADPNGWYSFYGWIKLSDVMDYTDAQFIIHPANK